MFLDRAFGSENCHEDYEEYYGEYIYYCDNNSDFSASVEDKGSILVGMPGDWPHCSIGYGQLGYNP